MVIQTDGYSYCKWYEGNPLLPKCPYMSNMNYCNLYNIKLKGEKLANMDIGRDEYCVERCEQCKIATDK